MTQFNLDLEDGKPPVIFVLKADDGDRFMAFMAEFAAASETLKAKGYTFTGGQHWRPSVGKAPDFDLLDTKDATIATLREALAGLVGASELDELKGMEAVLQSLTAGLSDADRDASVKAIQALIATASITPSSDLS